MNYKPKKNEFVLSFKQIKQLYIMADSKVEQDMMGKLLEHMDTVGDIAVFTVKKGVLLSITIKSRQKVKKLNKR